MVQIGQVLEVLGILRITAKEVFYRQDLHRRHRRRLHRHRHRHKPITIVRVGTRARARARARKVNSNNNLKVHHFQMPSLLPILVVRKGS